VSEGGERAGLASAATTCSKPFGEELLELLAAVVRQEVSSVLSSSLERGENEGNALRSLLQRRHERRARFRRTSDLREELLRHILDELVPPLLKERLEERCDLANDLFPRSSARNFVKKGGKEGRGDAPARSAHLSNQTPAPSAPQSKP
jgi:hypothetical protein